MPTIKVNTSRLSGYESDMQNILSRVNSIMGQFDSVSRNLDWDIRAESNINSRLSGISRELSAEARGISGMKNYLGNAVRQYNTVENTNKKNKLKDEVTGNGHGIHVNTKNNKTEKTDNYSNHSVGNYSGVSGINSVTKDTNNVTTGSSGPCFAPYDPNAIYVTSETEDKEKGLFGTVAKGSVLAGETSATKWFFGYKGEASAKGNVLGGKIKTSSKGSWDSRKGEIGAEAKVSADGYLATGEVSAGLGLASIAASGTVGAVGASGKIGATLFKNGKFAPTIGAEAKAEASVAKGDVKVNFGSDDNNLHGKASGQVLTAEAKAKANIGKIEYEDSTGNTKTGYGAELEVGAEAYAAKGSISGGFTLFGIKVDAEVEGKSGGAGAKAGGSVTSSSASGELGLGLLLGLGVKVNVDWSNFSLFK